MAVAAIYSFELVFIAGTEPHTCCFHTEEAAPGTAGEFKPARCRRPKDKGVTNMRLFLNGDLVWGVPHIILPEIRDKKAARLFCPALLAALCDMPNNPFFAFQWPDDPRICSMHFERWRKRLDAFIARMEHLHMEPIPVADIPQFMANSVQYAAVRRRPDSSLTSHVASSAVSLTTSSSPVVLCSACSAPVQHAPASSHEIFSLLREPVVHSDGVRDETRPSPPMICIGGEDSEGEDVSDEEGEDEDSGGVYTGGETDGGDATTLTELALSLMEHANAFEETSTERGIRMQVVRNILEQAATSSPSTLTSSESGASTGVAAADMVTPVAATPTRNRGNSATLRGGTSARVIRRAVKLVAPIQYPPPPPLPPVCRFLHLTPRLTRRRVPALLTLWAPQSA